MDGYVRVSRVAGRSGESFISPDEQRGKIEQWAKLRGVEIAEWHEDLDQSGGKLSRPGLDAMLARVAAGDTDGVVVAKLDRLSRLGVGDALKLVERITDAGGTLAAVDLGIDPTTPFGEFGMTIMLAMARMERRRLTDAWAAAQGHAIKRGAKVSRTPVGYVRLDNGSIGPHPVEAPIIREAYRLAGSKGIRSAWSYLEAELPDRPWHLSMVRRVLANRAYVGESRSGQMVNKDAHEPLVSLADWHRAQSEPDSRRRKAEAFPLSGFATCGTCGEVMSGSRGKVRADGTSRRTYRCSHSQVYYKRRGEACPAPASVMADDLEQICKDALRAWYLRDPAPTATDDIGELQRALESAETRLNEWAANEVAQGLPTYFADLASRDETYKAALAEFQAASRDASGIIGMIDEDEFLAQVEGPSGADFERVVRSAFTSITVAKGHGEVERRVRIAARYGDEDVEVTAAPQKAMI